MRRRLVSEHKGRSYDIRKDLLPEQLELIGAIAIAWNQIEDSIDTILPIALRVPFPLWLEVTTRINGFDGKIAILKGTLTHFRIVFGDFDPVIRETLGAVEQHKRYRDGVIHVRIADPTKATAPTAPPPTRQDG
jgi:hypothetical protein